MKNEREVKNGGGFEEDREVKRKKVIKDKNEVPGDNGVAVNGNKVEAEIDEDDDDDDDASKIQGKHSRHVEVRRDCPYLDTVNRQVLDFDFERFCSVSLSNLNVYACLVCGKYFQGRSQKSHAYTHSLEAGHHVYINLLTEKHYKKYEH